MDISIESSYDDLLKLAKGFGKEVEFHKAMHVADPYKLQSEVCWSALHYLEFQTIDQKSRFEEALEFGLDEWIK